MMDRRRFLGASAGFCTLGGLASRANAELINRNARLLVGFPAGGSIDTVARLVVEQMKGYAASMIVDNRPGAGGRTALEALRTSDTDGSVLVLTPGDQITLFPHIYKNLSYAPLRDFAAVGTVCTVQFLLTVGSMVPSAVTTLAGFIEWCRANPKLATFASPGAGTRPHFIGATLAQAAGFEFLHAPYKGSGPAVQDLLGGRIPAAVFVISNTLPHVQSGALRALATTAPQRSRLLPQVPTMREAGFPALEGLEWFGVFVPAATPAETVTSLNGAVRRALETDSVKAGLAQLSFDVAGSSASDLGRLIRSDAERWGEVVKATGFSPIE
jgi:tripartite-type tricarboxylate transporter receptor subunit TctC